MDDAQLTRTICEILGGIPGWEWWPDPESPPYPKDSTAIWYGPIQDGPDRAIGVRVYGPISDTDLLVRRVQLRSRGRQRLIDDADRMAGIAFTVLHELSRVGGISDIRRISGGPLGADSKGREERSDNYQIILDNPEAIQ
ncbi:minor capsid protein [Microbacterium trichothecenolyticum]|uniref:phage tail terminator protein n=1 Tax=Microbacterium trichothecenolyticum TaxID=69370 RepID=UPI0035BE8262